MKLKQRLDLLLVERRLAESREKAQALILAGSVKVDGHPVNKSGRLTDPESHIEVKEPLKYVSRGGWKLEAALTQFAISVRDRVCMDVGTSTGGFTDCLLQHGAARVHAVDTGAGQINWKLRSDPRVILHESVNARYLAFAEIGEMVDVIACDVSFISVALLVQPLAALLAPDGDWIILIKPQFEVGRERVGKGGIVRDSADHALACHKVSRAVQQAGFATRIVDSPILGAEGNREFLMYARRDSGQGAVET